MYGCLKRLMNMSSLDPYFRLVLTLAMTWFLVRHPIYIAQRKHINWIRPRNLIWLSAFTLFFGPSSKRTRWPKRLSFLCSCFSCLDCILVSSGTFLCSVLSYLEISSYVFYWRIISLEDMCCAFTLWKCMHTLKPRRISIVSSNNSCIFRLPWSYSSNNKPILEFYNNGVN